MEIFVGDANGLMRETINTRSDKTPLYVLNRVGIKLNHAQSCVLNGKRLSAEELDKKFNELGAVKNATLVVTQKQMMIDGNIVAIP